MRHITLLCTKKFDKNISVHRGCNRIGGLRLKVFIELPPCPSWYRRSMPYMRDYEFNQHKGTKWDRYEHKMWWQVPKKTDEERRQCKSSWTRSEKRTKFAHVLLNGPSVQLLAIRLSSERHRSADEDLETARTTVSARKVRFGRISTAIHKCRLFESINANYAVQLRTTSAAAVHLSYQYTRYCRVQP